jgi:hypothetical protein
MILAISAYFIKGPVEDVPIYSFMQHLMKAKKLSTASQDLIRGLRTVVVVELPVAFLFRSFPVGGGVQRPSILT